MEGVRWAILARRKVTLDSMFEPLDVRFACLCAVPRLMRESDKAKECM